MKKTHLRGTQTFWLAVPRGKPAANRLPVAFQTQREAVHFVDHRTEGWGGWRLVQAAAFAEYRP